MKRAIFYKTTTGQQKTPPLNQVSVWVDTNNVFTSQDSNGTNVSIGSVINVNTQTGTTYSLTSSDGGKIVECDNISANVISVPSNASVPFLIGTQILVTQYNTGNTSFTFSSPVVVRSANNRLKMTGQYSAATLVKRGTDEWYLFGDISS